MISFTDENPDDELEPDDDALFAADKTGFDFGLDDEY